MAMSKSLSSFAVPEALDPKRSTFLGVKLVFIAFKIRAVCRIVILLYKKEVSLPNFFRVWFSYQDLFGCFSFGGLVILSS